MSPPFPSFSHHLLGVIFHGGCVNLSGLMAPACFSKNGRFAWTTAVPSSSNHNTDLFHQRLKGCFLHFHPPRKKQSIHTWIQCCRPKLNTFRGNISSISRHNSTRQMLYSDNQILWHCWGMAKVTQYTICHNILTFYRTAKNSCVTQ